MNTDTLNNIRQTTWHSKTFVLKRASMAVTELASFFAKSYGALYNTIYRHGMNPSSAPCGIFFSVSEDKSETDVAAAVPVKGSVPELPGFTIMEVPDSAAVSLLYTGPYDKIGESYQVLEHYMATNNLKATWMIEEYLTDPNIEKDPEKLKTVIYFLHQ